MILIKRDERKKYIEKTCYNMTLHRGLSKATKALLKRDIRKLLKEEGITRLLSIEVAFTVCVWARTDKVDDER